jgi:sortase A
VQIQRRLALGAVAGLMAVAGGIGVAASRGGDASSADPPSTLARLDTGDDNPLLRTTTSNAAAATTTTTGLANASAGGVRVPVPADLPIDPYAETPEIVVGRISIPKLGLDEPLNQGMTLTAIDRGPSHWPGTALPGEMGNAVIAGHRTLYSKPFAGLDRLEPGDEIVYTLTAGTFRYRVTGVEVVDDEALEIADQSTAFTTTLFACHPPGSAAYRIVARAVLVDGAGQVVPALSSPITNLDEARRFRS